MADAAGDQPHQHLAGARARPGRAPAPPAASRTPRARLRGSSWNASLQFRRMRHHPTAGCAWTSSRRSATRRTHKVYRPDPVPRRLLDELFELARWAPNHHLTNPWRFRVLGPRSLEALKQARSGRRGQARPRAHAGRLLGCADRRRASRTRRTCAPAPGGLRGDAGRPCPRHRQLLAHARGAAQRTRAGRAVGIAAGEHVLGLLHLGYADRDWQPPPRADAGRVRPATWTDDSDDWTGSPTATCPSWGRTARSISSGCCGARAARQAAGGRPRLRRRRAAAWCGRGGAGPIAPRPVDSPAGGVRFEHAATRPRRAAAGGRSIWPARSASVSGPRSWPRWCGRAGGAAGATATGGAAGSPRYLKALGADHDEHAWLAGRCWRRGAAGRVWCRALPVTSSQVDWDAYEDAWADNGERYAAGHAGEPGAGEFLEWIRAGRRRYREQGGRAPPGVRADAVHPRVISRASRPSVPSARPRPRRAAGSAGRRSPSAGRRLRACDLVGQRRQPDRRAAARRRRSASSIVHGAMAPRLVPVEHASVALRAPLVEADAIEQRRRHARPGSRPARTPPEQRQAAALQRRIADRVVQHQPRRVGAVLADQRRPPASRARPRSRPGGRRFGDGRSPSAGCTRRTGSRPRPAARAWRRHRRPWRSAPLAETAQSRL